MRRWRTLQLIALAAALVLMVVLVAGLGPRTIAARTAAAGAGALWLLVAYAAGTALGALPWHVLLPDDARPGLRAAIESRFAASGANAILPLFGFGGEPVRLLWMRPRDRAAGVAAIVIDRLIYAAASAVFLLAGAIAALGLTLPSDYALGAAIGALALLSTALVAAWLIGRHRIAGRVHTLIRRLRRRASPDESGFAGEVDRAVEQILARRGGIALALALSVVARVVLGAEIYAGFRALGVALPLDVALVLAAVPVFLGFAGAIVPSQLGIQEGSLALVASAVGIPAPTAVAVVLLQRVRQLVTSAIAWAAVAVRRAGARRSGAEPRWNGRCTSTRVMRARIVAFASTLLAALLLGPSVGHLLELPNKLALPPEDYLTVQQIYRGWALLGLLVGAALIATVWLCVIARTNPPVLRLALGGLGAQLVSQAIFWVATFPVNVATRDWTTLPPDWVVLRARWEWSHAAGAIANLVAVACLIGASIRVGGTTPRRRNGRDATSAST